MKSEKAGIKNIGYYVLGNVSFNVIFAMSKTIMINKIGGKENFVQNLQSSFAETFWFYTIMFAVLLIGDRIYKKTTIHQLNQRLNQVKKGSEENEK